MPDISGTIRTLTLADGTVSGLVSTRMYSDALPQNATMPAITYFVVNTDAYEHLGGIVDIARARIQIDCFAATRTAANALADAVRLALEKYEGTVGTQFIHEINLVSGELHGIDRPEAGTDQRRYITSMDFHVHYQTTTS